MARPHLLISWNVAGWATTVASIKRHHGSVPAYFSKHGVSVLALQEVKARRKALDADLARYAASMDGWETFWACSRKPVGLNGWFCAKYCHWRDIGHPTRSFIVCIVEVFVHILWLRG